jgi:predicted SprT family Zn-dependent metalloprotease
MTDDVALRAIATMATAIDARFFGSKLRVRRIEWLPADDPAAGICWPEERAIAFQRHLIDGPSRRPLIAVIGHEMAHVSTTNEVVAGNHGPRWQATMRRMGLCPITTAIVPFGPFDLWLRECGL